MGSQCCSITEKHFDDIDLFKNAIQGGSLHPCQLSGGSRSSHLLRIACKPMCLDVVSAGPAMLYEGVMPANCYTLSFVMHCPGTGHSFNFSKKFSAGWLGFFPPAAILDGFNPAGSVNGLVTIPVNDFFEALAMYYPDMPQDLLTNGFGVELRPEDQVRIKNLIGMMVNITRQSDDVKVLEHVCVQYGRYILPSLLVAIRRAIKGDRSRANGRVAGRYRRLRRARDYVASHLGELLSVEDLSSAAGLSERGVENLFSDLLGVNPVVYLRHQRLHNAHRFLVDSAPCCGKVKEAALNAGFWHMGRFSHYYHSVFGESPNQTLARSNVRL